MYVCIHICIYIYIHTLYATYVYIYIYIYDGVTCETHDSCYGTRATHIHIQINNNKQSPNTQYKQYMA